MGRQGPESRLTSAILKGLRGSGGFWFKVHGGPYQQAGLPDIIGCHRGIFYGMEVKLPGEPHPVTPLQAQTLAKIASNGGRTSIVHSVEEALGRLEPWDEEDECSTCLGEREWYDEMGFIYPCNDCGEGT